MLNEWKCNKLMKWLLVGALISLAPLSAQTLTWGNTSDSVITPNMVIGDSWTLNISGATVGAQIVLKYTQNNGQPAYFTEGYIGSGGSYYSMQPVTNSVSLGTWTNVWMVGGVQVGQEYDYEVIDKPTSLTVDSISLANPNCNYYGNKISVRYQIKGASGSVVLPNSNVYLEPWEDDTFYDQSGGILDTYSGDVGPTPGYSPPSTKYASDLGKYYDIPIGDCWSYAYSNWRWAQQASSIKIGSMKYPVRSVYWTSSGTGIGTGSVSNGVDVSYSN